MSKASRILYGGHDLDNYFNGAQSIGELFIQKLTVSGGKIILIDAENDTHLTGIALRDRSIRIAECLRAIDVRSSDTVAICCPNNLLFPCIMVGTSLLGACLTPMNPLYTAREIEHAVQLSRPRVVFADSTTSTIFGNLMKRYPFIERIIVLNQTGEKRTSPVGKWAQLYSDFVANPNVPEVLNGATYKCAPQDIAKQVNLVLYSSGTTGMPKGVQLSQLNSMLAMLRHRVRESDEELAVAPNPLALSIVPFFHTFGCHVCMLPILLGETVVSLPRFEPKSYLRAIQTYGCTTLCVAPPLMVFLAKSALVDDYDLSTVRVILSGAAPLTAAVEQAVYERLNAPVIRQGYGMTEGTMGFTMQSDRCHTQGSVGELTIGTAGRIAHIETGELLGPREEGELQFRGNTMIGYVDNEAATNEMVGKDGWLRTGDIGYYTESGEWFVVDRLKELIKYKGFQVAPAEIEGLLLQMPQISDCGVVGVPDERAGEVPLAFVVTQPNERLTAEQVEEFVRQNTTTSKWLRGGVRFVAEIPKNPSGKILRRELRALVKKSMAKL